MVTTDAGLKAFATDAGSPLISYGPRPGATYALLGDEHGRVQLAEGDAMRPGDLVACVVPHCDPTVNLYGQYLVIRGDAVTDRWTIASGKYRGQPR
jgi:D-serine deaminase-like pyridoxal phosphate-dependent protein